MIIMKSIERRIAKLEAKVKPSEELILKLVFVDADRKEVGHMILQTTGKTLRIVNPARACERLIINVLREPVPELCP